MPLSAAEIASRLSLDFRAAMLLRSLCVPELSAYPDESSFQRDKPIAGPEDASRARIYKVRYAVRTLTAVDATSESTVVKYDLLAGGSYPFTVPLATVMSRPVPWSPHFHSTGTICLGAGWQQARGKMLLAHLVIHVAKLLNFDEPVRAQEDGFNPAAATYWLGTLRGRPLNPELVYPDLPAEFLVHGITPPVRFAPRATPRFAPAPGHSSLQSRFAPRRS